MNVYRKHMPSGLPARDLAPIAWDSPTGSYQIEALLKLGTYWGGFFEKLGIKMPVLDVRGLSGKEWEEYPYLTAEEVTARFRRLEGHEF